jgi:hypothetical protein
MLPVCTHFDFHCFDSFLLHLFTSTRSSSTEFSCPAAHRARVPAM